MPFIKPLFLAVPLALVATLNAVAAETVMTPIGPSLATVVAVSASKSPRTLTAKERLGDKSTDQQRIDNCKVPAEKRGTKARSGDCDHLRTSGVVTMPTKDLLPFV